METDLVEIVAVGVTVVCQLRRSVIVGAALGRVPLHGDILAAAIDFHFGQLEEFGLPAIRFNEAGRRLSALLLSISRRGGDIVGRNCRSQPGLRTCPRPDDRWTLSPPPV